MIIHTRGGAVARQVVREHENINFFSNRFQSDGVLSLGYITFKTDLGYQGILFRLTPGTTRMTFKSHESFKDIITSEGVRNFGKIWGTYISQGFIAMSHPENIVVNMSGNKFYPTDLSDLLSIKKFPVSWGHRKVSLKEALKRSLVAVKEIYGYNENLFEFFKSGLLESFVDINSTTLKVFHELKTFDEIVMFIMKNILHPKLAKQIDKSWITPLITESTELLKSIPHSNNYLNFIYENLRNKLSSLHAELKNNISPDGVTNDKTELIDFLTKITKNKDTLLRYLDANKNLYGKEQSYKMSLYRVYMLMQTADMLVLKDTILNKLSELKEILESRQNEDITVKIKIGKLDVLIYEIDNLSDIDLLRKIEDEGFEHIFQTVI